MTSEKVSTNQLPRTINFQTGITNQDLEVAKEDREIQREIVQSMSLAVGKQWR